MKRYSRAGRLSLFIALVAVSCGISSAPAGSLATTDEASVPTESQTKMVTLHGNGISPYLIKQDLGRVPDSYYMPMLVLHLKRDAARQMQLDKFVVSQRNPRSPHFHQWLTAVQFGQMFGPPLSDIRQVSDWLRSQAFHIQSIAPSGMDIVFSGNAGAIRNAFHAELHQYRIGSEVRLAAASDPQIPASLVPKIASILSLNGASIKPMHTVRATPNAKLTVTAKSAGAAPDFSVPYNGNQYYLVGPQDFLKIYNVAPIWNSAIRGAGQTIAVVGDSDMLQNDWNTFRTSFGLSSYAGTLTQIQPGGCTDPGFNGNEKEAALDTEWASVTAPDASIELASCSDSTPGRGDGGLIAARNLINSTLPPQIISYSFGDCESTEGELATESYNNLWQQAAAEGIAVFVASGDASSSDCDDYGHKSYGTFAGQGLQVNAFASSSYDVAVGGTDFSDSFYGEQSEYWSPTRSVHANGYESALSYAPEMTWNDTCASSEVAASYGYSDLVASCNDYLVRMYYLDTVGGGGGTSIYISKPSWQNFAHGSLNDTSRDLPDVALFSSDFFWSHALLLCMSDANQNGYPCNYDNDTDAVFNAAGGTSFAAPAFAGIQALINQKLNSRHGAPNYALYQLGALEYNGIDIGYGSLSACNASNGNQVGSDCVFYDITEGNNDVPCVAASPQCYGYAGGAYNTGVLSTSPSSLAVSYSAGSGWDAATGLGSVNVTNLVNAIGAVDGFDRTPYVPGDINGDGMADVLLRNPTTRQVGRWLMNGTAILHSVIETAPAASQIKAVGDFNHDGKADVVWENGSLSLAMWLAEGESGWLKTPLGMAPSGTTLVGSGDIDADGNDDLVFENLTTNQITIWKMQGSTITGTITAALPAGYQISAVGDFDGDGFADLAITTIRAQQTQQGLRRILKIMFAEPGGTFTTFLVGTYPAASIVIGAGDIDGDTHDDLVFYNSTSGSVTVWLMVGHTVQSTFNTTAPTGYSVVDMGDFDGDGRADLLITSSANDLFMWLSQPGNTFSSQEVGSTSGPIYPSGWSIVASQAQ